MLKRVFLNATIPFIERNLNPKAACLKRRGDEEKHNEEVNDKRMNMSGSFDAPKRGGGGGGGARKPQQMRRTGNASMENAIIDVLDNFYKLS